MALNVVYDALEAVSFVIDLSNSLRGTLIVSSAVRPGLGGRIVLTLAADENSTLVEVFPNSDEVQQIGWITVMFDEMQSLLMRGSFTLEEQRRMWP